MTVGREPERSTGPKSWSKKNAVLRADVDKALRCCSDPERRVVSHCDRSKAGRRWRTMTLEADDGVVVVRAVVGIVAVQGRGQQALTPPSP